MKKLKKIAIIGTVGLPSKYGGWETLVDQLTKSLKGIFDFTVYCSSKKYSERQSSYNGAKLVYIDLDANGSQSIIYDLVSMLRSMRSADVLLILGVSGCVFLPIIKLLGTAKLVVNIDGLEWKRDKWGSFAKWFLKVSEAIAVRFADVVVADNAAIAVYVKQKYAKDSALIPYGGDHANKSSLALSEMYPFIKKPYAFKVCRIEPENNIDAILAAFKDCEANELVIVGNWNNSDYGVALREAYRPCKHIHLLDPIYESDKLNCLRSCCRVYLHGHSAGGTNPSLVEAMSLALPIIAFDCEFNRETTENSARYFRNAESLRVQLNSLNVRELIVLGTRMKEIADRRYTWKIVASQYSNLF